MLTQRNLSKVFFVLLGFFFLTACTKDPEGTAGGGDGNNGNDSLNVRSKYDYPNVSYSGQLARIAQLDALSAEMKKTANIGTSVNAQTLAKMYANTGGNGGGAFSGIAATDGKQLRSKTATAPVNMQTQVDAWLNQLATASMSTDTGRSGRAGVVFSANGAKKYLLDANGWDLVQLIQKSLIGAVFYKEITANYINVDDGQTGDNEKVVPGKGTELEHHWDEAFGYFGVPIDFPANLNDLKYIGSYSNRKAEPVLTGINQRIMNAFLKGRAAISAKKLDIRNQQSDILFDELENVFVASALNYLNSAASPAKFGDDALRNHALGEAYGFVLSLKFNPRKTANDTQIKAVLDKIGDPATTNLYNISRERIIEARDLLASYFGGDIEAKKTDF